MFIKRVFQPVLFSPIAMGTSSTRSKCTFTDDLIRLQEWLLEHDCPAVAMESTGIYWRAVHNILEESFQVVLANARDMRNVIRA
jgi:transposase